MANKEELIKKIYELQFKNLTVNSVEWNKETNYYDIKANINLTLDERTLQSLEIEYNIKHGKV